MVLGAIGLRRNGGGEDGRYGGENKKLSLKFEKEAIYTRGRGV